MENQITTYVDTAEEKKTDVYSEIESNDPELVASIIKDSEVSFDFQKRKYNH